MKKILTFLMAGVAMSSAAAAEDLSVVGSWSSLPLHQDYEAPFWQTALP